MGERLETGWLSDTPAGDNVIRRTVLAIAGSIEVCVGADESGRVERTDDVSLSDTGRNSGFQNSAVLLRPVLDVTDPLLDVVEGFFAGEGTGDFLLWSAWPTPDLTGRGWKLMGHPPLMLRPPVGHALPLDPPSVDIELVATFEAAEEWARTAIRAYPLEGVEPDALLPPASIGDDRLHLWVAYSHGRAVGTAAAFVEAGLSYVTYITVDPEARGSGLGEALTWRATLVAPELPAVLLSSALGRPIYERMGYLTLYRFSLWSRDR